jgi:hypothetical protein
VHTVEYFVTMSFQIDNSGLSFPRTYVGTLEIGPGELTEVVYRRVYDLAREKYRFWDYGAVEVTGWSLTPNRLLAPFCGWGTCMNKARPDSDFCDGHER